MILRQIDDWMQTGCWTSFSNPLWGEDWRWHALFVEHQAHFDPRKRILAILSTL
jgi:hypothetical protein